MKKDPGFIFRLFLMLGDAVAIIVSFFFAYFIRTHIDQRPYYFEYALGDFILTTLLLIPVWLILLALLGLYQNKVINSNSRTTELGRILVASVVGVMVLITYDFFFQRDLFPVRTMAAYAMLFCFLSLSIIRLFVRKIRVFLIRKNKGVLRTIIVGNNINTRRLIDHISISPNAGYKVVGVVSNNQFIPDDSRHKKYTSIKEAIAKTKPDVIFQTDERQTDFIYEQSITHHLLYYFVPSEANLSSHIGELELVGETPAILVKVTPLASSGAKFIKRSMDIVLGLIAFIIALIPMIIIWIIEKIADPKHSAFYSEYRLSRYNRKVKIYKFRSMKPEFSGLSPEEAFTKMGKEHLIKKYRDDGDYLKNDPRITKLGHFLRASSLDELPQLFNVIKGDISLVGPRALVPGELKNYGDRSLLLSVKSGLTGLAQVSGRRDISFDERRSLDLYYIQNWSLATDIQILFRTVIVVFTRKGAK